ncbi:DUF5131 family protein [Methylobacterium gnaphalii]|uniref:Phage Gp37/Gp68 family protein n=1 Tax=Methylobacterium gnaphalii TaxID=1010610 RepID=A0A512JQT4_9HYPH|nr:phage Gp37/Gp68 family protein [Methylobacterium gnaphalii]GEP12291.1 hypothetical protein MGN01_41360 [Methylobacterium gnaphalii]GJD68705.1 hypothetical protein MMMDOFMJ_1629 [Methylobacterium gnaphalii]GLS49398.1 hypothetical protein GCM10007885_22460 [Methylobacterium gnaphalii]
MAEHSTIEWTDATWNPITGCSVVSPGCTSCYAMGLAGTRLQHHPSRAGLTAPSKAGPVWNGTVRFNEEWLTQPLQWKRPRMIFVCAHGDLFHENVPDAWIDRVFAVMALAPQHTFQVLTKRSARMRRYMAGCEMPPDDLPLHKLWVTQWSRRDQVAAAMRDIAGSCSPLLGKVKQLPLPNVWLGVSTEDQKRADQRVPDLLETPAAVRFVSAEPLLGPIDFSRILLGTSAAEFVDMPHITKARFTVDALKGAASIGWRGLDWIIVGGESGQSARPMHPRWARSLRDQCAEQNVAFLFKQWGEYGPCELHPPGTAVCSVIGSSGRHMTGRDAVCGDPEDAHAEIIARFGKSRAGRLLDGVEHNGMPQVRG